MSDGGGGGVTRGGEAQGAGKRQGGRDWRWGGDVVGGRGGEEGAERGRSVGKCILFKLFTCSPN